MRDEDSKIKDGSDHGLISNMELFSVQQSIVSLLGPLDLSIMEFIFGLGLIFPTF